MKKPDRITQAIMKQTDLMQAEVEAMRERRRQQGRCEECGQRPDAIVPHLPDCQSK